MKIRSLSKSTGYAALIVFLFLIPLFITSPYYLHILIMCGMNVVLAASLRVLFNAGELSLAHGGMMSLGAYTAALLVMKLGISSWAAMLIAGLVASLLALIVGYPFFRLKGIYFALVTAFLSEVVGLVARQWDDVTGGTMGLMNIPKPDAIRIPGLVSIDFSAKSDYYYLLLVVLLISLLVFWAIERSRLLVTWNSIRESNELASSVGVNVNGYKVLAFSVCCFFPGMMGAFYAQYMTFVAPTSFGFVFSIYIIVYLVVGGARRFSGPIVGALILTALPELARSLQQYQPYIFAGVMVLIIFLLPKGIVSIPQRVAQAIRERRHDA